MKDKEKNCAPPLIDIVIFISIIITTDVVEKKLILYVLSAKETDGSVEFLCQVIGMMPMIIVIPDLQFL